jgi:hypothetical protein
MKECDSAKSRCGRSTRRAGRLRSWLGRAQQHLGEDINSVVLEAKDALACCWICKPPQNMSAKATLTAV